eukprot:COSAG01_NODE_156_length_23748_cov_439.062371_24_plen_73_part_00
MVTMTSIVYRIDRRIGRCAKSAYRQTLPSTQSFPGSIYIPICLSCRSVLGGAKDRFQDRAPRIPARLLDLQL